MKKLLIFILMFIFLVSGVYAIDPILWNTLDNDADVVNSLFGVNGVWTGSSSYTSMQSNNGSYIIDESNYISMNLDTSFIQENGTIEMWFKPIGYGLVNGVTTNNDYCYMFSLGSGNIYTYLGADGSYNYILGVTTHLTGINIVDGETSHIAFVWAKSGIDGTSDTLRIYQDNILIHNTSDAITTTADNFNGEGFGIGHKMFSDQNWAFNGGIDEIKWWNYAKTDFGSLGIPSSINGKCLTIGLNEKMGVNIFTDSGKICKN